MNMTEAKARSIQKQIKRICQDNGLWFSELEDNQPKLRDIKFNITIRVFEPLKTVK